MNFSYLLFFQGYIENKIFTQIANMSVSNEEPEIISLCEDLVEDLVHAEPEIVENQNDVDLPTNDLNQSFASKWPLEPCLDMVFNDSEDAHACYKAYARRKGFSI